MLEVTVFVGAFVDPAIGAHAVVHGGTPDLELGAASAKLRDACGGAAYQRYLRECLEDEPLRLDDCLVTTPGTATAFRWVLHVPALELRVKDPETGGTTGPTRVSTCFRTALSEATTLARANALTGRLVVATPLLGAGGPNFAPLRAANILMMSLASHLRDESEDDIAALGRLVFTADSEDDAHHVRGAAARNGIVLG